jgi:hypothetical protein
MLFGNDTINYVVLLANPYWTCRTTWSVGLAHFGPMDYKG